MFMPDSAWMVRAGNNNELIDDFREESLVAVGWPDLGDLSDCSTRESIKEQYTDEFENRKQGRINTDSAQLHMVVNRIKEGDLVLSYNKDAREYLSGIVDGPYKYDAGGSHKEYPHTRPVDWDEGTLSRDDFSTPSQNILGGALTVFSLDDCHSEIQKLRSGEPAGDGVDGPPYIEVVESRSEELISDVVADIDPIDFEELVAGVLRAMGYAAQTTQRVPDYGVDIVAHPDALGFEEPLVKVQVKQTKNPTGNQDVGRFLGTLNDNEKGLYVSTGGFTKHAKREVQAKGQVVTLLDRNDFIELLLDHYPSLEQEYKAMVPLKRVYIPTEEG